MYTLTLLITPSQLPWTVFCCAHTDAHPLHFVPKQDPKSGRVAESETQALFSTSQPRHMETHVHQFHIVYAIFGVIPFPNNQPAKRRGELIFSLSRVEGLCDSGMCVKSQDVGLETAGPQLGGRDVRPFQMHLKLGSDLGLQGTGYHGRTQGGRGGQLPPDVQIFRKKRSIFEKEIGIFWVINGILPSLNFFPILPPSKISSGYVLQFAPKHKFDKNILSN